MPLTFGGKPSAEVATRSPQLPLAGIADAKRDERRAKDDARLDRCIRAARWRGEQCAYLGERVRRLQPIQGRLARWLDTHSWRNPRWQHRNARYWTVAHTILAHEREMRGFIEKVEDLVKKKPLAQQERITAAFFAARNAPAPTRRPATPVEEER